MRISSHCSVCGSTCFRKFDGEWTHYNKNWNETHRPEPVVNPQINFQVTISYAEWKVIERMRGDKN